MIEEAQCIPGAMYVYIYVCKYMYIYNRVGEQERHPKGVKRK